MTNPTFPSTTPAPGRTSVPARAFTMINLLVSMAILVLVASVAIVSLAPDDRARVLGGADLLGADLEHAQAMSLVTPNDPIVVRIDAVNDGYWLERRSEPDVAITRPDGTPYVVIFGTGDAATYAGVDLAILSGADNAAVEFDAFGRLVSLTNAVFQFSMGEESVWLTASSTTGFVSLALAAPEIEEPPDEPAEEEGGGVLGDLLGGLLGG